MSDKRYVFGFGRSSSDPGNEFSRRLRQLVHRRLIDSIEEEGALSLENAREVSARIRDIVEQLGSEFGVKVTAEQQQQLEREIHEELGGMGPLAPLMLDGLITDILVNGPKEVWIDRGGRLQRTDIQFDDEAHLRGLLDRIISKQGRHLDATSPTVDARLPDGSRLHAVIPPLCSIGPIVSIRRFREEQITAEELVERGVLNRDMLELLGLAVFAGQNVVIAGSAGAGKTTLLNVLARYISKGERIVTIEETAELNLDHPHVIPLETKSPNSEGRGGVTLRELVRTALRMRADRIVVGEVRGNEVLDMLQAMNVGHDGSLTTVHANSPRDVLRRLEALAHMGDSGLPRESIRDMIGSAIQLVVQLARFRDGTRRVVSISEVRQNADQLETVELFRFRPIALAEDGTLDGQHEATGQDAQFIDRAKAMGFDKTSLPAMMKDQEAADAD